EGLSTQHNPEFTMLEFYQAYADYRDLMTFTERMFRDVCQQVLVTTLVNYQGNEIDFGKPFTRLSLLEAIEAHVPEARGGDLRDPAFVRTLALALGIEPKPSWGIGKL